MTTFAYSRVSTLDQNPAMQTDALIKAYPESVLREEKASATTTANRPMLELILDMIVRGIN